MEDLMDMTYEDRLEMDQRERASKIAYLLAPHRIYIEPALRQLLGFMLYEPAWMPDPITKIAVRADGDLWARHECPVRVRTPMEVFMHGPPPDTSAIAMPLAYLPAILPRLQEVCRRAELSNDDTDWLMSLPRIHDFRSKQ